MKTKIVTSSLLAFAVASPGFVLAQEEGVIEEIVVTGSLIKGTPEDAALPVEVHTAEDMALSGAPTALEFAKSLTSSGPTTGEAYYFSGAELTGNVQYNLRGIGADKTLVLFNGRRVNENTSIIPSIVTQRIEVLKDGAAVTYGADATGGVVNFITKDNYEGIEVSASYKAVNGSDGEYSMQIMGGFGGEDTNIIWAAEWEHRSELDSRERDFSSLPFGTNPAPWSTLTNVARYFVHGPLPDQPTNTLSFGAIPTGEFGAWTFSTVLDYDQSSCEAVGGVFVPGPSNPSPSCNYGYLPYYNLVEDQDIYRLYGQITSAVTDNMDFYLRTAYSEVDVPHSYGSPSQPVVRGPARHNGLVGQFYIPSVNPYVSEFAARTGAAIPANGGLSAVTYRAFAHGGNDLFAEGNSFSTPREINNKYYHISTGLNGEFSNEIGYDFGLTYNHNVSYNTNPDIIGFRLQEALNGFGGPNCNAVDNDPYRYGTQRGTPDNPDTVANERVEDDGVRPAGCQWYNPFVSNFAGQPVLGLANPNYGGPGFENSAELERWLFDKREQTTVRNDITIDFVLNGETPIELAGGNIGWGAGVQYRNRHSRESVPSDFYNGAQPCQWAASEGQVPLASNDPDFTSCGDGNPGPFQFFGINPPDDLRSDQRSAFAEFSLPVLDTLYFGVAARYEEFNGGLDTTVFKVSGQWSITDNLSIRGSYGTNYQAPGIGVTPGEVTNGVNSYSIAGNAWLGATTVTRSDIEPETATVYSFGAIWNSQGFTSDSDFRFIVDYFNIETEDELGLLATANDIAGAVFHIDNPASATAPNFANCSHALVSRVTFNGSCIQGTTTARDFASITTEFGNGPSQLTSGFDIQADYSFPFLEGDLSFGLTATLLQELENGPAIIDGYAINDGDDRLGDLNFAVVAGAGSKLRSNLNVNYAQDIHNLRLVLNFISGVRDERYNLENFQVDPSSASFPLSQAELEAARTAALTPAGYQPGTTDAFEASDYGVEGEDWLTLDMHYTASFEFATVTASIVNLADQDPPESRQELGYDPRIGNPLGRTFEVGIRKEF